MDHKVSIRFFNDRMVRAVWDEENWKYLKSRLKKSQPELVSATNQLKLMAADGKQEE